MANDTDVPVLVAPHGNDKIVDETVITPGSTVRMAWLGTFGRLEAIDPEG